MIAMNPNDTSLERDRLRIVIATIVINMVVVSLLVDYTRTLDYSIGPESFRG